jgi:hypothetical protein
MAAVVGLAVAACGGGGDEDDDLVDPVPTTADDQCKVQGAAVTDAQATGIVEVQLSEYAIVPQPATTEAGPTRFVVRDEGLIAHELMVVQFDGDPAQLPLNPVGGVDMSQLPADAVVGWVRRLDPGHTCRGTFELATGRYVLLCNQVDDATNPHYGQGMRLGFAVT